MDCFERRVYCWCQLWWPACDGFQLYWSIAPNLSRGDPHGRDVLDVPSGRRPVLLGSCINAT